jgi:serine/threonine protein phosphatase 1
MKTYVIGDVHGCFRELNLLLETIDINFAEDRLIMLGDYIDRGEDSKSTVKLLMELKASKYGSNIGLIKGNHEQMAIDEVNMGYHLKWSEEEIEFFKSMPAYIEDDHFFFVHAGIDRRKSLQSQNENDLLWIRESFYSEETGLDKIIVFGHTPTQLIDGRTQPLFLGDKIAIDTGCVFGGSLTSIEIDNGAAQEYSSIKNQRLVESGFFKS